MLIFPEKYRIAGLPEQDGGAFKIPFEGRELHVIASNGLEWDHVSVSLNTRNPNWREMCYVKELFFEPEDCVFQLHPPKSKYISLHPFCLHLWRPHNELIPMPPAFMV